MNNLIPVLVLAVIVIAAQVNEVKKQVREIEISIVREGKDGCWISKEVPEHWVERLEGRTGSLSVLVTGGFIVCRDEI